MVIIPRPNLLVLNLAHHARPRIRHTPPHMVRMGRLPRPPSNIPNALPTTLKTRPPRMHRLPLLLILIRRAIPWSVVGRRIRSGTSLAAAAALVVGLVEPGAVHAQFAETEDPKDAGEVPTCAG